MNLPLVSILIPLYNHEHYIIQCLNSILSDDYKNKEIIIIDDCSTDNGYSIASEWIKTNNSSYPISLKRNPSNMGICHTLNDLVKISKGEYVLPLASDDGLIAGSIDNRLAYLEKNKSKMAVFGDCYVIDTNNQVVLDSSLEDLHNADTNQFYTEQGLKRQFIWNWSIVGPSILIDRRAYDAIGFYNEKMRVEDWDFYLRLVSNDLIGYINEKVGLYRIHHSNASRRKTFGNIDTEYELLKIAVKNLKNFHGEYKYLLMKKSLVYIYLIFRKLSIAWKLFSTTSNSILFLQNFISYF